MSALRLMIAEIGFRRTSFALSVLAVVVAAAMFVAGPTLVAGYANDTERQVQQQNEKSAEALAAQKDKAQKRLNEMKNKSAKHLAEVKQETESILAALDKETTQTMRDLGFNLNIVHKDTNMSDLYMEYTVVDMPEEYIHTLAKAEEINMIRHLKATLQAKIKWNNRTVLLVGFLPEVHQSHMSPKKDMGVDVEPGTVIVGHELAAGYNGEDGGLKAGDTIEISGPGGSFPFTVAEVAPERGDYTDVILAVHLHDAQKILDRPGKISQIMALGCHCAEASLPNITEKLAEVLPDTKITEQETKRIARAKQRDAVAQSRATIYEDTAKKEAVTIADMESEESGALAEMKQGQEAALADLTSHRDKIQEMIETLVGIITPLAVLAAAAFVGLMSWTNVRERRTEIGILRALGKTRFTIGVLFLGKAVAVGLLGGVIGLLLGLGLSKSLGGAFDAPIELFSPPHWALVATVLGAPLVAALASYVPTVSAVRQDPALVLQDQ